MEAIFPATAERVSRWADDPDVLGIIWVGSKSRGYGDSLSDDDLEVLLTDEAAARKAPGDCLDLSVEGDGEGKRLIYDAQYLSRSALEQKIESPFDLDHWPYEHSPILFDRDGRTREIVESLGRMDPEFRRLRLRHATIDAGGAAGRAIKTAKRGAGEAAVRILVASAARALSRVLFALEGRWVPLDHWFEPELRSLDDPTGAGPRIVEGLNTNRGEPLIQALKGLEDRLFDAGVPRPPDRLQLFLNLIHPSAVRERAVHGMH